jgi:hypothetical protein
MTSKEFKALKAELTRKARIIVIQRKPNTCIVAEVEHNGQRYIDFGFSKANWPDWFLSRRGKEIALGRAINEIACRIDAGMEIAPTYPEFYVDYVIMPLVTTDLDPQRVLDEVVDVSRRLTFVQTGS